MTSKQKAVTRRRFLGHSALMAAGLMAGHQTRTAYAKSSSVSPNTTNRGTFSICAYDPQFPAWGVAVTSQVAFVGPIVIHVDAYDTGDGVIGSAVASQALADTGAGERGLQLMLNGSSAQEALDSVIESYEPAFNSYNRQFGFIDSHGNTAAFTGQLTNDYTNHIEGENFVTQGNILTGPEVLEAVADSYANASPSRPLWYRLLDAMQAGEAEGGDSRPFDPAIGASAAIKIMGPNTNTVNAPFLIMDARVDNAENPLDELADLVERWVRGLRPTRIRR